jgi:hypothetical protein
LLDVVLRCHTADDGGVSGEDDNNCWRSCFASIGKGRGDKAPCPAVIQKIFFIKFIQQHRQPYALSWSGGSLIMDVLNDALLVDVCHPPRQRPYPRPHSPHHCHHCILLLLDWRCYSLVYRSVSMLSCKIQAILECGSSIYEATRTASHAPTAQLMHVIFRHRPRTVRLCSGMGIQLECAIRSAHGF